MTIRNKLIFSSTVYVLLALAVGVILLTESRNLQTEFTEMRNNYNIVRTVFDLNILANEYLIHAEERPLTQWWISYDRMKGLLKETKSRTSESGKELQILERLERDHGTVKPVFQQLVDLRHNVNMGRFTGVDLKLLEQRLTGMITTKLQSMVADSAQFYDISRAHVLETQKWASWMIMVFIAIMVGIQAANLLIMNRAVVKPLQVLNEGVDIVGSGNLKHLVPITTKDEIGSLAGSFNRMTLHLNESREKLEQEINERKQVEMELESKASELTESNSDLKQFAYVASHDLQEPLRNIVSCIQLLSRKYQGNMGPEADQYINYAVEAAKRMQHLIEDLLEYSRVERKTEEVSLIQSDEALASANQNLHSAITESGAVINSGPLPRIFADPTLLTQLFQNLIGNAIKFRKNEPPTISITAEKMDEDWVFSIRDNGIGMEKEYLERIFVIFQRLHARSQYPGTGIGLAIAKKIVERHGGRIWVESQPGMGTTFFFTFKGENGIRPSLEQ